MSNLENKMRTVEASLDRIVESVEIMKEALEEAMKRYPDSIPGLTWFGVASGLFEGEVTQDVLDWAESVIEKKSMK